LLITWSSDFHNKLISIKIVDADVNTMLSGTFQVGNSKGIIIDTKNIDLKNNKLYVLFIILLDNNFTIQNDFHNILVQTDDDMSDINDFCEKLKKNN